MSASPACSGLPPFSWRRDPRWRESGRTRVKGVRKGRRDLRGLRARQSHSWPRLRHRGRWKTGLRAWHRRPGPGIQTTGDGGYAVSHRVDDQGLHGAHGSEAARRRQTAARRARGNLRRGNARLEISDAGLTAHPRARPAEPHRGLRHRRPLGRSPDADGRSRVLQTAARRRAFHPSAGHGLGVFEPGLRPARPDHHQCVRASVCGHHHRSRC